MADYKLGVIKDTGTWLLLGLCATSATAGEFFESAYQNGLSPKSIINWGGLAVSSGGDSGFVNISPLYVDLPLGEEIVTPVSFFTTQYFTGSASKKHDLSHAILSPYSGHINVNMELFHGNIKDLNSTGGGYHEGLCAFPSDMAGLCNWSFSLGVKALEYQKLSGHYDTTTALYGTAGLKLDIPISRILQENSSRLTVSSLFVIQHYDTSGLFRAYYEDQEESFDGWLKSLELGLNYTISRSFSIQLTGAVLSSESKIKRLPQLELIYRPYY